MKMNDMEIICPYCKTKLTSKDDVVFCSDCGMPHHKECWVENQGCTTFGCTGSISAPKEKSVPVIQQQEDDFEITFDGDIILGNVYCWKCGKLNDAGNAYCSSCGSKLIKK